MTKKGVGGIILLLTVLLTLSGCNLSELKKELRGEKDTVIETEKTEEETQTVSEPEPGPAQITALGNNTYRDEKYGIEFTLPEGWRLVDRSIEESIEHTQQVVWFCLPEQIDDECDGPYVFGYEARSDVDLTDYLRDGPCLESDEYNTRYAYLDDARTIRSKTSTCYTDPNKFFYYTIIRGTNIMSFKLSSAADQPYNINTTEKLFSDLVSSIKVL